MIDMVVDQRNAHLRTCPDHRLDLVHRANYHLLHDRRLCHVRPFPFVGCGLSLVRGVVHFLVADVQPLQTFPVLAKMESEQIYYNTRLE